MTIDRRTVLMGAASAGIAWVPLVARAQTRAVKGRADPVEVEERSLVDLQADLAAGRTTSQRLVSAYAERIDRLDRSSRNGPHLASVLELNPDALGIAQALDAERKTRGARGPLHGIPILLKDNIDTHDRMQTSAGSLALIGSRPFEDAFIVQRLRAAGAVILGKTNLSEWANIRSSASSSGWSGRGGLVRNPYALDRSASGSSSGSAAAVAASLCAAAVGTETDGSILSPSSVCGLVGLKPTVGLLSRSGIVPIAHSQDTAGPMARSVRDCALLLGAMVGHDPRDAAMRQGPTSGATAAPAPAAAGGARAGAGTATEPETGAAARPGGTDAAGSASSVSGAAGGIAVGAFASGPIDYAASLDARALRGARLGVVRKFFGFHEPTDRAFVEVLAALEAAGAVLVDPVALPDIDTIADAELTVLLYELKADLNAYLQRLGPNAPVKSLADVIAFNERHAEREMPWFGQDLFIKAQAKGPLTEAEYQTARALCVRIADTDGISTQMRAHRLDALIAPTGGPAWRTDLVLGDHFVGGSSTTPAAVAGTPGITVPAGAVHGLPIGLSFFAEAWSEAKLLKLAYAFEQATRARRPPGYAKSVAALGG